MARHPAGTRDDPGVPPAPGPDTVRGQSPARRDPATTTVDGEVTAPDDGPSPLVPRQRSAGRGGGALPAPFAADPFTSGPVSSSGGLFEPSAPAYDASSPVPDPGEPTDSLPVVRSAAPAQLFLPHTPVEADVQRPRPDESAPAEPRNAEPRYPDPQYAEPQYAEPQYAEPQYAAQQYGEPQYQGQPQYADPYQQYPGPQQYPGQQQHPDQQYAQQQYPPQQYADQQYGDPYGAQQYAGRQYPDQNPAGQAPAWTGMPAPPAEAGHPPQGGPGYPPPHPDAPQHADAYEYLDTTTGVQESYPPLPDAAATAASERKGMGRVLVALGLGALVFVGLGAYGRLHEPTGIALNLIGFSSGIAAKAWLGSAAFLLAIVQVISARRMYRGGGRVTAGLHRWSGRVAVLVSVPVAIHCLYAFGFDPSSPRVLVHSIAGCFVYGAFVAKMIVLGGSSPRWTLPVLGGAVFAALAAIWATSSLWFFGTAGLTF